MATSIGAASMGYGFAWLPEEKIRAELAAGILKPLLLREGGERFAELYLIFADRDAAGPSTLRLAEIIREKGLPRRSEHVPTTRSNRTHRAPEAQRPGDQVDRGTVRPTVSGEPRSPS
jgi:hypothetical protein